MNWEVSLLFSLGRVSVQLLYFFLKMFDSTHEAFQAWNCLGGKALRRNSISFSDVELFRLLISSQVTFDISCLKVLVPKELEPSQIWKQGHLVMDVIPGALGTTWELQCPHAVSLPGALRGDMDW